MKKEKGVKAMFKTLIFFLLVGISSAGTQSSLVKSGPCSQCTDNELCEANVGGYGYIVDGITHNPIYNAYFQIGVNAGGGASAYTDVNGYFYVINTIQMYCWDYWGSWGSILITANNYYEFRIDFDGPGDIDDFIFSSNEYFPVELWPLVVPTYSPTPQPTLTPTSLPTATCGPCLQTIEHNLQTGWNLIGFQFRPIGISDADDFTVLIEDYNIIINTIANWTSTGWELFQPGLPFNNFEITNNQGLMIMCAAGGRFQYQITLYE